MPRIYCQGHKEKHISMIGEGNSATVCRGFIAKQALDWVNSKRGRTARPLHSDEMAFYFSDGKLAATVWVDFVPTPEGEPQLAPAVGEVPGLVER